MPPPLFEIRRVLPNSAPAISDSNWDELREKGWSWDSNLYLHDVPGALDILKGLQDEYGIDNVTVGTFFDDSDGINKPINTPSWFAIYTREDPEVLVAQLHSQLDDLAALEEWLNKEEE